MWVPTAASECITLSAALITSLGVGHFCFIGIIESSDDPGPDRTLIDSVSEFHSYISKSNNYAWRNCNVVPAVSPEASGDYAAITRTFQINGFGHRFEARDLEVDTRDLPEGTQLVVWIPEEKLFGLKAYELRANQLGVAKVAGALQDSPTAHLPVVAMPMTKLAEIREVEKMVVAGLKKEQLTKLRALQLPATRLFRLAGLTPKEKGKTEIRFVIKFPRNTGTRDVTLSFRERGKDGQLGQMNYIFKVRAPRR
jgi:hypothetical protein